LKFYTAFNALYYRSRCSNSELVTVELLKSDRLSLLLYAVGSSAPSKKVISMLNKCVDDGVSKIFRMSSSDNCAFIRTCLGLYHIEDFVRNRTAKFMYNLCDETVSK